MLLTIKLLAQGITCRALMSPMLFGIGCCVVNAQESQHFEWVERVPPSIRQQLAIKLKTYVELERNEQFGALYDTFDERTRRLLSTPTRDQYVAMRRNTYRLVKFEPRSVWCEDSLDKCRLDGPAELQCCDGYSAHDSFQCTVSLTAVLQDQVWHLSSWSSGIDCPPDFYSGEPLSTTPLIMTSRTSTGRLRYPSWRIYSSPDKSFSVELPAPLIQVGAFSGEHGVALEPVKGEDNSQVYAAPEGTPEDARFGIVVAKARQFGSQLKREQAIEYLSWLLLADEDELQFMKPSKKITSNGLVGREYFYIKEPTINSPMFTRGRIFDTGQKIYILIFIGKDAQDLGSAEADRFFNSFRLTKHQTKRRKAA